MRNLDLAAAMMAAMALAGCLTVEMEIPVATEVAVIEGNAVLNKAGARLHGEIMDPARIDSLSGIGKNEISSINLADFRIQVTGDSLEGPADADDLMMIEKMVVYVRSVQEDSKLKPVAVGWYYRDEDTTGDLSAMVFDVDDSLELKPFVDEGFELFTKASSTVPADDVSVEGIAIFLAMPAGR